MNQQGVILLDSAEKKWNQYQFRNKFYFSSLQNMPELYASYTSSFSIKFVLKGKEHYAFDQHNYTVSQGQYLLINDGQEVDTSIKGSNDGISIFIDPQVLRTVYGNLNKSHNTLLSEPSIIARDEVNFFEHVYSSHDDFGVTLKQIASNIENYLHQDYYLPEEWYFNLSERLLCAQFSMRNQMESLDRVKKSTREELYRRILNAKDYIHDNLHLPINLDMLALETGLSKFHLIKIFHQCYYLTPYQYLMHCRIKLAKNLLNSTVLGIEEIGCCCGFDQLVSFSRAFKQITGLSPSKYRQMVN